MSEFLDDDPTPEERIGTMAWWAETSQGINDTSTLADKTLAQCMRILYAMEHELQHVNMMQLGSVCVVYQALKKLRASAMKRARVQRVEEQL